VAAFTATPHPEHEPLRDRHLIADEAPLAAATAALYANIDHHLVRAGSGSPLTALDRDYYLFDMPLLNRCNMNWWTGIHDNAKALGLRVMLTGEIGNMSLSYAGEEYLPELLRSGRLLELARVAAALLRTGAVRKRGLAGRLLFPFLPAAIERRVRGVHDAAVPGHNAMTPAALARFRSGDQGAKAVSDRAWCDGFAMRLHVMGRHDPGNHNKGYVAGWKIDQRDPTGDRRLVEYMLAAPMADYVAGGQFRNLPKRVLADRLPPEVLGEPGKGRQGADWHLGLTAARAELREELDRLRASGATDDLLDLDRLDALERDWPSSGWASQKVHDDYRLALLRSISVGHFLRKSSGGNA
jgi:asparagine synthase (glutamine-hydrolysing)